MAEELNGTQTTTTDADPLAKFNEAGASAEPAKKGGETDKADAKNAATETDADAAKKDGKTDKTGTDDGKKDAGDGAKDDKKTKDGELTIESYASLDSLKEEGVTVDKDALKNLKELALENKWDAATAEKIVKIQMQAAKKQAEAYKELQKSWEEANAKTYGDNLKNVETNCSRVLTELDKSGKFKELLALAGAEKHPATLEFLKTIGDKLLEKPMVNPNATATSKEVSLEDFN